jgi:hypothetical protein
MITRRTFLAALIAPLVLRPRPLVHYSIPTSQPMRWDGLLAADWINDSTYRTPYLGLARTTFLR